MKNKGTGTQLEYKDTKPINKTHLVSALLFTGTVLVMETVVLL